MYNQLFGFLSQCEDLRLLEEELRRGYRNLATVSRLREQCLMSLWKGEIKRLKSRSWYFAQIFFIDVHL